MPPGTVIDEEYVYDGAGNLIEIRTAQAVVPLSLADFNPKQGGFGQLVVVTGTGFSPVPALDSVQLNGLPVTVIAATPTQLSFAVPAGATSGRITVATGGGTVTSATDFIVVPAVVISDFTPKMGKAGTVVTITGSNFDPDPSGDSVRIGDGSAPVSTATYDSLVATVGATATSGKITVTTGSSSATSTGDFFVIPGTLAESNIGSTGRADPGAPAAISITDPGKAGLLLFDGTQGQYRSLFVSGVTFAGSTKLTVYEPAGTSVFSGTVTSGQEYKFVLPALPRTGTYTTAIEPPATSTGGASIQVFEDVLLALDPRGGTASMTLARGQNGRLAFTGRPGDFLGLGYTAFSATPAGTGVALSLLDPDGTALGYPGISAPGSWQLPELKSPGSYTFTVRPSATSAATITFLFSTPITGKLTANGAATRFQTARVGQSGRYTFDAVAGQSFTLHATAGATFPTGAAVTIYQPSGEPIDSLATKTLKSSHDVKLDLGVLPFTGTYAVAIVPKGVDTGTVDLGLVSQACDELVIGAPEKEFALSAAQNGRYVFTGTAGQHLAIGITGLSSTLAGGVNSMSTGREGSP